MPSSPCVSPTVVSRLSPVNKRLDEWVTHDRLDLKRVQVPRKEAKTPTKNGLPGSRPGSPERDPVSRGHLGDIGDGLGMRRRERTPGRGRGGLGRDEGGGGGRWGAGWGG